MMPFFREEWGNPSSSYRFGSKLKNVIESARKEVAGLIGAHPLPAKRHTIASAVEHSAVLSFCRELEKMGFRITACPWGATDGSPSQSWNYLSLTGHKIGATKDIGALFVRRTAPFSAFIQGGHQERGRRGGTESVPLVKSDKSHWLARGGYTAASPDRLMADLRTQILALDATPSRKTPFGESFEIRGELLGPSGHAISVRTIWLKRPLSGRFISLH